MQEAIGKARTLIEALEYIQHFRDKIVVVKMGGSIMDDPEAIEGFLTDIVFMQSVGMQPVIIHGGGKAISSAMDQRGLEVQFVEGRRYTDQRSLTVVEHVLCKEINDSLVETIGRLGGRAMGLHTRGSCVLFGEKLFLTGDEDRKIDLGLVGQVTSVNADLLRVLCGDGIVPVLAPLARDKTGMKLNCNADTAAGAVAETLVPEKFVLVSDTHGIRRDPDDPDSLAMRLNEDQVREMIASGVISSGMLPKVEACLRALDAGVSRAHIIDGRFAHSLLLEIFSVRGVGTLLTK
jgi:acetylglutamate kinase